MKIRGYLGPKKKLFFWYGWHFSYLGGSERVLQKLQNFSYQEYHVDLTQEKSRKRNSKGHAVRR